MDSSRRGVSFSTSTNAFPLKPILLQKRGGNDEFLRYPLGLFYVVCTKLFRRRIPFN